MKEWKEKKLEGKLFLNQRHQVKMTLSASNSTQSFHQFEAAANFQMSSDSDFEEDNLSPAYGLNLK